MKSDISSKTLKRVFANSPIPMTLSSPVFEDCPLVLANDAFLDLTGYSRDDIIGRNCRFMQGPKTDPVARARLRYAVEAGSETLVPIVNYRKDGSEFENYVFLLPVFGQSGKLLYIIGSQCDVTMENAQISAMEHAKILDESIDLSNRSLIKEDRLQILAGARCSDALQDVLSEAPGS